MDSFGGPFATALRTDVMGAALTDAEKKALETIAKEAGVDVNTASTDPAMAAAARARVAASGAPGAAAAAKT